jgi:hypothetical protein
MTVTSTPSTIEKRPRPILIELASALLIVGAVINLLFSIDVLNELVRGGSEFGVFAFLTIALATTSLGLGIAIRYGRLWLVTLNVSAVLGFLELMSMQPVGIFFGAIDVLIVIALVRERPWFEWLAHQRRVAAAQAAKGATSASPGAR